MDITLAHALTRRRSTRVFAKHAIPHRALEKILWAGQGKSGEGDGRTVPSAHALYPLRLFVMAGRVDGLESGLYAAEPGGLDLRNINHADLRPALCKAAIGNPEWIANAACIIAICADMLTPVRAFVEQHPYGARGERYIFLEAGAAAQNIQLMAVAEGLGSVLVGGFNDEATASVLALAPPLAPVALMCLGAPVPER